MGDDESRWAIFSIFTKSSNAHHFGIYPLLPICSVYSLHLIDPPSYSYLSLHTAFNPNMTIAQQSRIKSCDLLLICRVIGWFCGSTYLPQCVPLGSELTLCCTLWPIIIFNDKQHTLDLSPHFFFLPSLHFDSYPYYSLIIDHHNHIDQLINQYHSNQHNSFLFTVLL